MLTQAEIDALIVRIVDRLHPMPEKVIVFGSYAKGTATVKSDLDLFVIQETGQPPAHRADSLTPLLSNLIIPVDVHVYTPEEVEAYGGQPFEFVNTVLKTGRILFERVDRGK